MSQTEVSPVPNACRHMRARYKMQVSHKSPFPDKRLVRYECELGHEIDSSSEEEIQKCCDQKVGCWKSG